MSTAVDVLATPTHCRHCGRKRSDNPLVQSHVRCPVCLTPHSMVAPEATLAARLYRYPALRKLYGIETVPGFPLTQTIYDALQQRRLLAQAEDYRIGRQIKHDEAWRESLAKNQSTRTCPECHGEAVTRGNCRCETCDGRGWIGPEVTAGDTSLTKAEFESRDDIPRGKECPDCGQYDCICLKPITTRVTLPKELL